MSDATDKLQQDPAEGSRAVIERELAKNKQPEGESGNDARPRPDKEDAKRR